MYIYLSPLRPFWSLSGTDIVLSRANPVRLVTDEELKEMTEENRQILQSALNNNTITLVSEQFAMSSKSATFEQILSLPATDIQRRYVSRMALTKDVKSLQELLKLEKAKESPRQSVLNIIQASLTGIFNADLSEQFYGEITESEEVIEDLVIDSPAKEPVVKSTRRTVLEEED